MTYLNITRSDEVQATSLAETAPALLDAGEIRSILDTADAALEAARNITDAPTAEAVRELAHGLNAAGVLLLNVASGYTAAILPCSTTPRRYDGRERRNAAAGAAHTPAISAESESRSCRR